MSKKNREKKKDNISQTKKTDWFFDEFLSNKIKK
jgi:hypothetical protein